MFFQAPLSGQRRAHISTDCRVWNTPHVYRMGTGKMFHVIRHKGVKTTEDCRNASLISANISTRHNPRAGWAWLSRLSAYVCASCFGELHGGKRLAARGAAFLVRGTDLRRLVRGQERASTTRSATAFGGLHADLARAIPAEALLEAGRGAGGGDRARPVFAQHVPWQRRGLRVRPPGPRCGGQCACQQLRRYRCPASTGISSTCRSCIPKSWPTRNAAWRCSKRLAGDGVKYAIEHRDIIERFGRFPHRNRALGRQTTQAEQAFLAGHEGFGQ